MNKQIKKSFSTFLLAGCWVIFVGCLGALSFMTVQIFRMGWLLAQVFAIHFHFNF